MKVLGVRTSPSEVRYAVLSKSTDGTILFENMNGESKLLFPAECTQNEQKLFWLYQELERVIRLYPDIEKIGIKSNEYGRGGESSASRDAAYFDAVVFLYAGSKNISVESKLYRSIGMTRKTVKNAIEERIGRTNQYWDEKIADAIAVALHFIGANDAN